MHNQDTPHLGPDQVIDLLLTGALAFVFASLAHEAAGHGAVCAARGGEVLRITSVFFRCSAVSAAIDLAGPLGNALAAALAATWLVASRHPVGRVALFAWVAFCLNAFWFGGYALLGAITGKGDWAVVLPQGQVGPRVLLALAAVALYVPASRWAGRVGLRHGLTGDGRAKRPLPRVLLPWIGGTVTCWLAAALDRRDTWASLEGGWLTVFGASAILAWMAWIPHPEGTAQATAPLLPWSPAARALGACAVLAYVALVGRGYYAA